MAVRPWASGPEPRLHGKVLAGRYRLDALLGRGGAADVHQGFDLRLRRAVAVKVFRASSDTQTEERFTEEGILLARLQHPGLVTVYDAGRDKGEPFLIMDLVEGPTLRERITRGRLQPAEVGTLGAALADALAYVHAAGVVHRDVKPSNVLMDTTGSPRLTDFGISRLIDSTTHTASGALIGTAAYLAPEQVLGQHVGPAADIYALGLTLLECLKGDLEYDGTQLEAAIARLHRPPSFPPHIGHDLTRLLKAMTALEQHDRPDARSCAEVLSSLGGGRRAPVLPSGAWTEGRPQSRTPALYVGPPAPAAPAEPARPAAPAEPADPADPAGPADSPGSATSGTVVGAQHTSSGRRPSRRTMATVGTAVATLLGATLTGSLGDLSGSGADAASGPDGPRTTAPATEPSSTPPRQKKSAGDKERPTRISTTPAAAALPSRTPQVSGTDREYTATSSEPDAADPQLQPGKNDKAAAEPQTSKNQDTPKSGKRGKQRAAQAPGHR
ncbi:serine/threonine-protein kinase [Streptomyces bullii]|uniref:non-specific serine/threonine protein kinase n=1 Tax=Streptomyces bullii TaxID=349910 RepID=A0ABW0UXX4_9ACTN